jgi:hypothetical protein
MRGKEEEEKVSIDRIAIKINIKRVVWVSLIQYTQMKMKVPMRKRVVEGIWMTEQAVHAKDEGKKKRHWYNTWPTNGRKSA